MSRVALFYLRPEESGEPWDKLEAHPGDLANITVKQVK